MEINEADIKVKYDTTNRIISVNEKENEMALNKLKGTPAEMSATESVTTKKPSELATDAADAADAAAAASNEVPTLKIALTAAADALRTAASNLDTDPAAADTAADTAAAAAAADTAAGVDNVPTLKGALNIAADALRNASTALSGLSKGGKRRSKKGTKKVSKKGGKKRSSKKSRGGNQQKQRGGALDFSFFGKESHIETGTDKSTSVAGSLDAGLHPVVPRIRGGRSKSLMNGGGCGLAAPQMGGRKVMGGSALAYSNYKGGKRRTKGGNKSLGMRGGSARKY